MKKRPVSQFIEPLDDDDLLDVNGGVGRSDVSGEETGCRWFYAIAGTQSKQTCENCFYYHPEKGKAYCSHPHFGK